MTKYFKPIKTTSMDFFVPYVVALLMRYIFYRAVCNRISNATVYLNINVSEYDIALGIAFGAAGFTVLFGVGAFILCSKWR